MRDVGGQDAARREGAGVAREHDLRHLQLFREADGMQAACTAECGDGEIARVGALLEQAELDRRGHIRVDDRKDALGGLLHAEAERSRNPLRDGGARLFRIELQCTAEEKVRIQAAENDIGVGDGRLHAAFSIGDGPRIGAGASRPHAQRPSRSHGGD